MKDDPVKQIVEIMIIALTQIAGGISNPQLIAMDTLETMRQVADKSIVAVKKIDGTITLIAP